MHVMALSDNVGRAAEEGPDVEKDGESASGALSLPKCLLKRC